MQDRVSEAVCHFQLPGMEDLMRRLHHTAPETHRCRQMEENDQLYTVFDSPVAGIRHRTDVARFSKLDLFGITQDV